MATGSEKAVYTAIFGNTIVTVAKFGAFFATGSAAMWSEGVHSLADVSNQVLLALGIARSRRNPDQEHPYGYGRAQFVWALISAVGIFFLGCGVTLYHGVTALLHPHEVVDPGIAVWVLLFAFVVEGYTLIVALRAVSQGARDMQVSLGEYLKDGPDPMGSAVVLEDGAAVLGVMVAAITLGISVYTGDTRYDAIGSIVIGLLMGVIAIFLVNKNRLFLLDRAIPQAKKDQIMEILQNDPVVEAVLDVKATMVGADALRFKAEIEFDGSAVARRWLAEHPIPGIQGSTAHKAMEDFLVQYADHIVEAVGDEIDRIEREIRRVVPEAKHVDIETN